MRRELFQYFAPIVCSIAWFSQAGCTNAPDRPTSSSCATGCPNEDGTNGGPNDPNMPGDKDSQGKVIGHIPEGRLWRLTDQQYADSVDALLNKKTGIEKFFEPSSQPEDSFGNEAGLLSIDLSYVSSLESSVNTVVKANLANLEKQLPCKSIDAITDDCLGKFIDLFGEKAFHRPVTAEEKNRYLKVYKDLLPKAKAAESFAAVAEVILRSPNTIFRFEIGAADTNGKQRLTPSELAVALAYALTNSPPDEELLAKAKDGSLANDEVYLAEAKRLLAGDGFVKVFTDYALRWSKVFWLDAVTKNEEIFPEFKPEVKVAMKDEVAAFARNTIKNGQSNFVAFLGSNQTTITPPLAPFYNVPSFEKSMDVKTEEGERSGIITLPGVLAIMSADESTAPMHRASFLMNELMCDKPLPPPQVFPEVKPTDGTKTFRERFSEHVNNEACATCHVKMDAYGFSLDHYDPIGRYRTKEDGGPVDASGTLKRKDKENIDYKSIVDLLDKLPKDDEAQRCFIRKAFAYVNGRAPVEEDKALIEYMLKSFVAKNLDMSDVFLNLVTTDSFKSRVERK